MGWFNWIKTVTQPLVTAVEKTIEAVVTPVVEAVNGVIEPIVEVITQASDQVFRNKQADALDVVDLVTEVGFSAAFEQVTESFESGKYTPVNDDWSRFDPVVVPEQQKQSETIQSSDWTEEDTVELRDALVAAQFGFADYSDLRWSGAVDRDGYVTDDARLYAQTDWFSGIEAWGAGRFDVIRVLEKVGFGFDGIYEANVALAQNTATGEYFISVGGTDPLSADLLSDLSLFAAGNTGPSVAAITGMIDRFFAEDIADGAVVNLAGISLGGAEVLQQYHLDPDRFDHVYTLLTPGLGGLDGSFYEREVWDGVGDSNITEVSADDPGTDANDLITFLGHVGAGDIYHVPDIILADPDGDPLLNSETLDAHMHQNLWASMPGGADPILPDLGVEEVFGFA